MSRNGRPGIEDFDLSSHESVGNISSPTAGGWRCAARIKRMIGRTHSRRSLADLGAAWNILELARRGPRPPSEQASMPLMKLEPVSLSSANVTEKMVQEQIADDPSILGLGKLE